MHKKLEHLTALIENATTGDWGPTSAPARGNEHTGYHYLKEGERGEPTWGAIVSNADPEPGVDHERYAPKDSSYQFYEEGTDIYGGTLIAESIANPYNGQFMVEAHNLMPNLILLIEELRKVAEFSTNPMLTQAIIENFLGPDE